MEETKVHSHTGCKYDEQLAELVKAGYTTKCKNKRALHHANGDVEKAKQYLEEMKAAKGKQECEKHLPSIKEAGYEEQHKLLIAAGHHKARKNLKALQKSGGDVEKAKELLEHKKKQKGEWKDKKTPDDFDVKHILLAEAGFHNPSKNAVILKKSGGDVEKAKAMLLLKKAKKASLDTGKFLPALKAAGYEDKHQQLVEAGFHSPKQNLKALKKTEGDVEKAKQLLSDKKAKKETRHKTLVAEIQSPEFQKKNAELVEAGFKKERKNFKALIKSGGDVEKAKDLLANKWKKKENKKGKCKTDCKTEAK